MAAEASQFAMLDQLSSHRKLVNFHPRSISRRFQHNPTNPLVSFLDQVSLKTRSLQQRPCSKKIFFVSQADIPSPIVNTNDLWPAFQERREVCKSNVCLCRSPSGIFAEYDLCLEYLPCVCRPFTDRKKPLVAF